MFLFQKILTCTAVGLIEKVFLFPEKMLLCGYNLPYLEIHRIYKSSQSESTHNSHIFG